MSKTQKLREGLGWTRAELARRAKLNPGTISMIEAGRLIPYESQVRKLAKALGVSPEVLEIRQPDEKLSA